MASGEQRICVVSDLQVPWHSQLAVGNVLRFIRDWRPTKLINIGDDLDAPAPSAWSRGHAAEYAGDLQEQIDMCHEIHRLFREAAGDVEYHLSRSNHGDRTQKYIERYAPALSSLRCLELPALIGYDRLGIEYHAQPFDIAPGWVAAHGDEGPLSKFAGRTAAGLAERWGVSVVCGHSHRLGLAYKTYGYNHQATKVVCGFEVGHLMSVAEAEYLSKAGGYADWMSGIGLIYAHGDVVQPVPVPISESGAFIVEGAMYS